MIQEWCWNKGSVLNCVGCVGRVGWKSCVGRGSWVVGQGTWVTLRGSWVNLRGSWVLFTDNFA